LKLKITFYAIVIVLFVSIGFLFGLTPAERVDSRISRGAESGYLSDNPPPIDSINLVFSGIDYGASASSPQNYVNAKHIANVSVGTYYFPVVTWETGDSWHGQSLFSYWDDLFQFWSFPDSFTSNLGQDTGRPAMCVDSQGNLHFAWHQAGNPDGYETYYTRAILDTSGGVVQYVVERPAQFISTTNGNEETFPVMAMYEDTLIMIVWLTGPLHAEHSIGYNWSTDGGSTWNGPGVVYAHGGPFPSAAWIQCYLAQDPNDGDMWALCNWDYTGDGRCDISGYYWDASTDTWSNELVAAATTMHPYMFSGIVVDYNSIPHVIFQENLIDDGGSSGQASGYGSDPCGTLYYTHRSGGIWSALTTVLFPRWLYCNYATGWPSLGIAPDNTIYFSAVQPESANPDTTVYGAFNVHYAELSPYTGALSYGGHVSNLPIGDSLWAIYGHMTYYIPADGPGITWCQMVSSAPPVDVYYCHKDTLAGIEEIGGTKDPSRVSLYQNYPNPSHGKTMIRFTVPSRVGVSLDVYDISGRLVRKLAGGIPGAGSYFVVWDGKDSNGIDVPGGVYLYTLKAGTYAETRKLILVH
jgi:hypothetical protein